MKTITVVIALLLFSSGCAITRHKGRIEIFDAAGESTGSYVATLDRRMQMKVITANGDTVEVDSRQDSLFGQIFKSVIEFATLGIFMDN